MFEIINTDMVLGLYRLLTKKKEFVGVSITESDDYITLGTPGLTSVASLEDDRSETRILFSFPYGPGGKPRNMLSYKKYQLVKRTDGDYTKTHRIITMPSFRRRVIDKILPDVKKCGVITAIMNERSATAFVNGLVPLTKYYKYHSIFNCDQYLQSEERNIETIPIVSFFDIRHCIPIFNNRKVDGFGIIYETVLPDASKRSGELITSSSLCMVLSQFRENLFYVDGKEIHEKRRFISKEIVDSLLRALGSKPKEKEKSKAKAMDEEPTIKVSFTSSAYIYYGNTSTSTNTY